MSKKVKTGHTVQSAGRSLSVLVWRFHNRSRKVDDFLKRSSVSADVPSVEQE